MASNSNRGSSRLLATVFVVVDVHRAVVRVRFVMLVATAIDALRDRARLPTLLVFSFADRRSRSGLILLWLNVIEAELVEATGDARVRAVTKSANFSLVMLLFDVRCCHVFCLFCSASGLWCTVVGG